MKVLVVGATGATGQHALRMLLDGGHEVTALVRDPSKLGVANDHLRVERGDVREAADVARAAEGQDAILVALGPRSLGPTDVQESFARNAVAAMKKHGVKRIVNLSAWGAGDSVGEMKLAFKLISKTLLRNVWADKERSEAILTGSGIEFVNVRPGRLIDKPARGGVKAGLTGGGMKPEMTREDTARFMVDQLASDAWKNKSPLIGY